MKVAVAAKRWAKGWELHIEGHGVTQARTLADAPRQVADYLASLHDLDISTEDITVVPELPDELLARVHESRNDVRKAERELARAAAQQRRVAVTLRNEANLSVSDTAALMEVSRGRVSQLTSKGAVG